MAEPPPDPSPPVNAAVDEVKTEETDDDLMRAMQHSKEVMPALNSYGVSLSLGVIGVVLISFYYHLILKWNYWLSE